MLWDAEVKGFALRVTPGGAKSFVLDYRAEGRQRRITIGAWPDWTVAAARQTAKDMKREVDLGHDPMGERQAQREAPTVQEMWDRYAREHLPKKAERSQADERMMWEKIILPRFGKMKVAQITHDDVDALHRDITEIRGTPVRANRTVEVLRKAFNLAIRWKWRDDNPASGVRRNQEEKRNRYLNRTEIAALAQALNEHSEPMSANAIKLLMLTGARRGEVLGATWEMFDLENGVWTKPSAHTKQRKLHRVPLSGPAVQLLVEMKAAAKAKAEAEGTPPSPYVFPGPDRQAAHRDQADMGLGLPPGGARRGGAGAGREGQAGPRPQGRTEDRVQAECPDPRHPPFLRQHPRVGGRVAALDRPDAGPYAGPDHPAIRPSVRRSAAQGRRDGGRLRVAAPARGVQRKRGRAEMTDQKPYGPPPDAIPLSDAMKEYLPAEMWEEHARATEARKNAPKRPSYLSMSVSDWQDAKALARRRQPDALGAGRPAPRLERHARRDEGEAGGGRAHRLRSGGSALRPVARDPGACMAAAAHHQCPEGRGQRRREHRARHPHPAARCRRNHAHRHARAARPRDGTSSATNSSAAQRLGEIADSLAAEARALQAWYRETYPRRDCPTTKTIENNLRDAWRAVRLRTA